LLKSWALANSKALKHSFIRLGRDIKPSDIFYEDGIWENDTVN
jgi:hypothetical protein